MNKAPNDKSSIRAKSGSMTQRERNRKGETEGTKEMISILGSKDRSVSGKILIIQLWSPNENYSFFVPFLFLFFLSSLNYFFYSVLCVHFSVFFPFIGTLKFLLHRSRECLCWCYVYASSFFSSSFVFIPLFAAVTILFFYFVVLFSLNCCWTLHFIHCV